MTFQTIQKRMPRTGGRIGVYFLLCLAMLLPMGAWAQDAGEVVSVLGGSAEVLRDGRRQPLQAGDKLAAGDVVRTGAGSRAAIQLNNGMQIKLNANSHLELKAVVPAPEGFIPAAVQTLQNVLRVLSGEIWVRNSGEPLEIQTIPATATIRGTEFNLAVHPDDSAQLAVLNGAVEFGNPHGSVLVAANEQAAVRRGEAPRKSLLLNPLDAVQWSLYYPRLAGPDERDPNRRTDPRSARDWTLTAHDQLQDGHVVQARQSLERALALDPNYAPAYSLRSTIALVQNRKEDARADAERAVAADPASSSAYLSLSSAQQAAFDLDGALVAARQAVKHDPENAQALIQESSLLFGMGRLKEAVNRAERARKQAPDDAFVNTVWGFLQLARFQVDEARAAFEKAIQQDSTLGLPHLGLGLVLFRHNDEQAAVAEMRKATLLEPQISLHNSYLGKAFYESKDDRRAQKYLDIAKQLDPHDPTPYLYDAIRLQSVNRPIEAVENLQKSIELNDDRGVYRSRLLLDGDLAARSAALGRVYNEIGFTELGLQEARQSLSRDPGNASAHRLLADAYSAKPGIDMARASELLQAQLLQPLNITPVQPHMAETKLLIPNNGLFTPSLYEFNPLFVKNQPSLFFSGSGGNESVWGDEVIVSGLTDRVSYSLGQFHYQSDGYRKNNDLENNLYNLFVQTAVTPDFGLQAEVRRRETITGDLSSKFDGRFRASQRKSIDQDTARIGAHYTLSPRTDIIASILYTDRNTLFDFQNSFTVQARWKGFQTEAQLLHRAEQWTTITGLGAYSLDLISPDAATDGSTQQIVYSYTHIKIPDSVVWTVGLGYESDEDPSANLNKLNPKLGVQWAVNDQVSLRAAAFQTVTRVFAIQQSIEPTQIAGFNQLMDYPIMTLSKNYGVGLDVRFNSRLFGGVEAISRDLTVPVGEQGTPFYEIESDRENIYSAYLYWLPHRDWAISASWLYETFEVNEGQSRELFISNPARLHTMTIPLNIRYFNPSGFFAGLGVTYVNQDAQFADPQTANLLPEQNEDFTLVNIGLGYRFPKRWGVLSFQANNIFDRKFHFQDNGFQTGDGVDNPLYRPERTLLAQWVLHL